MANQDSTTMTVRAEGDLIERAISAFYRSNGILASNSSYQTSIDGKQYVVLENINGILAVYRVRADNRLVALDAEQWPLELKGTLFIHADVINGNTQITEDDAAQSGIEVEHCSSMEEVRALLRDMGDGQGETFERILAITPGLFTQLHDEYGIR